MRADAGRAAALGLPVLVLAAMLAQAVGSLRSAQALAEVDTAQAAQVERLASPELARHLAFDAPAIAPRAAMVRAVVRVRAAATAGTPQTRARLLDAAAADADRAVAAMPYSGQAWLASSFVGYLRDGHGSPRALRSFERSYAGNGYLYDSLDWRMRYAAAHWARLGPATRAAVAREGQWFGRLGHANRAHVYVLTGGTPVWRAISGSDAAPFLSRPTS